MGEERIIEVRSNSYQELLDEAYRQTSLIEWNRNKNKKTEPSKVACCSYCNAFINNTMCEECLISASDELLNHISINPVFIKNVLNKLVSLKAPESMASSSLCPACNENNISICTGCYYNKFEGSLLEEQILNQGED